MTTDMTVIPKLTDEEFGSYKRALRMAKDPDHVTVSALVDALVGLGIYRARAGEIVELCSTEGETPAQGMICLPGMEPFPWEPGHLLELTPEPPRRDPPPQLNEVPTIAEAINFARRTVGLDDFDAFCACVGRLCPSATYHQLAAVLDEQVQAEEAKIAQDRIEIERRAALGKFFAAWAETERSKGRPEDELRLGNCVRESGILRTPDSESCHERDVYA